MGLVTEKPALVRCATENDDIIHVINRLVRHLTTLVLDGDLLTDVAFLYLNNCSR
jgi:hypothetical protein